MSYWVVKGTRRDSRNDFEKMVIAGETSGWQTRRRPKDLAAGDRVFLWESSPGLRLIALAEILEPDSGESEGNQFYVLRFITGLLRVQPTILELRDIPELHDASFLKSGPAVSVLSLKDAEATALLNRARRQNPELKNLWPDILEPSDALADLDLEYSAFEGRLRLREHLIRERSRSLVDRKKQELLSRNIELKCEVCNFSFSQEYGSRGIGLCEVHHRYPISKASGLVLTELDDLAIVCSNCHRMLHREPWLSIEKLRFLVQECRGLRNSHV